MNKKLKFILLYGSMVFLVISLYFIKICPLIVFDGDDWGYISFMRKPFPLWKDWNPSRVLPEVLMPLVGYISAFIVYPITDNYIMSITITSAMTIAIFVELLFVTLCIFFINRLKLNYKTSIFFSLFFVLLQFIILKPFTYCTSLQANDLTCYFYYIIPSLLNFSIVLYSMSFENLSSAYINWSNTKKGLFIVAIYFAVFSNLYSSYIIAIYMFWNILVGFIKKENLKTNFKKNKINFAVISLWIVSVLFELSGGRAHSDALLDKVSYETALINSVKNAAKFVAKFNPKIGLLTIITLCITIAYMLHTKKHSSKNYILYTNYNIILCIIYCILTSMTFLILLSSKVKCTYTQRTDVMLGFVLFVNLFIIMQLINYSQKISIFKNFLPLLFVLCFFCAMNLNGTYYSNISIYDNTSFIKSSFNNCYNINNYLIDAVCEADKNNESSVCIHIPYYSKSNWPLSTFLGDSLSTTLYKHHITSKKINITLIPDKDLNNKFEVTTPELNLHINMIEK